MRNTASLLTLAAAALAIASTGCSSMVPFSYELRAGHNLTHDEVKNLQFYSSHEITLRREVQSQDSQVTPGHKLRLISGKSVEEVVIPARTPGVAVSVTPKVISVSFVTGTSLDFVTGTPMAQASRRDLPEPFVAAADTFLPRAKVSPAGFEGAAALLGQTYAEPPGPRSGPVKIAGGGGRYVPPEDLGGHYVLAVEAGEVTFDGMRWEAVDDTRRAHLLIDADKLEETEEKRTVLPGVRLGN